LTPYMQFLTSLMLNVMGFFFFIWAVMFIPTEAKFFIAEKLKRTGSVLSLMDGDGTVTHKHVTAKSDGVLRGKDRTSKSGTLYVFLHRLIRRKDGEENDIDNVNAYNDLIKFRGFLPGVKKPIYHGSTGNSIAATPKLLEALGLKAAYDSLKAELTEDENEGFELIVPWSVESLVEAVNVSYTVDDIQVAESEGYIQGLGINPKKMPSWVIPVALIAIALMVVLVLGKADLNIPFLGG